ncbi:hypothetical protein WA158_000201 [Blastocystis sp. Blastoise]
MEEDQMKTLFESIGLDTKTIDNTLKAKKKAADLSAAIIEAGVQNGCDKAVGNLIYNCVNSFPGSCPQHRPTILKMIVDGKIKSNLQITETFAYLKSLAADAPIDMPLLEQKAGVGIDVTADEIVEAVKSVIEENKQALLSERYCFSIPKLLYAFKEGRTKWADGKMIKDELDKQILALLGPITEEDKAAQAAKKTTKKGKGEKKEKVEVVKTEEPKREIDAFEARDLASAKNSEKLIEEHLKVTGGKIRTRFPPEPNGYIHIGHAKSMYLNFKGAFEKAGKEGECLLRFDDTNPSAEKEEFIDNIMEDVHWLGWNPLYQFAIQLIKMGKAYVCHQTAEEIKKSREIAQEVNSEGGRKDLNPESPWRNRSVEENLRLFEDMKNGKYEEGAATLRMKIDMHNPNPCMWDPVAYRIKYIPHPHVGDKWCIYPSYDFQHCLVDSLENIDYSLCTLEFEVRRESYYWLVDQLNVWRAHVWEFGRLNLTNTVLSKRRLKYMVEHHIVRDWDDPRMPTIKGLRRRGYPPQAINNFCEDISVTRTTTTNIDWSRLEHYVRLYLEDTAPRAFCVLDPVECILTNLSDDHFETITAPLFPKDITKGNRSLPFQKTVYIDRDDVKTVDEPKFLGIAPGKIVSLKYAYVIKCDKVETDENGKITKVYATVLSDEEKEKQVAEHNKKLGAIHWVCGSQLNKAPITAEIRLYDYLFLDQNPAVIEDWVEHINTNSEIVVPQAYIEPSVLNYNKRNDHIQFERLGYFAVDNDSRAAHIIINRTCQLRSK